MSKNKAKNKKINNPSRAQGAAEEKVKLPLRRVVQNNFFLLKIIMHACPGRLVLDILFDTLGAVFDFLLYTYLLRYAINGFSEGVGFGNIALMTALFFGARIAVYLVQGRYYDIWQPVMQENTNRYVQEMLFKKAGEVDLACYEDPAFYDKYIKALTEGTSQVDGLIGAGKSTLIKLLMRLYEPGAGTITLGGTDIAEYDLAAYRAGFGAVFQDCRQFSLSVAQNVLGRDPVNEADRELVISSLKKSGAYDRVMKMKNGIDTVLTREFDDEGEVLSAGESQKLAIARIFTRDNLCVIPDEPTSALDPDAEYRLNRNILDYAKDKTVIFISHRLSTTRMADRIYMFEDDRIAEHGTHEELIAQDGKYAYMFNLQAEKYR